MSTIPPDPASEATISKRLTQIENELSAIKSSLPDKVGYADIGSTSKLPMKALSIRESLLWRVEELGRCSAQLLRQGDIAAATLTSRAVMEAAALMLRLHDLIRDRAQRSTDELDSQLMQMLFGFRNDDAFPKAINILTCIDHMDRSIPTSRATYDQLSEVAHPNWSGVGGLFSFIDNENYTTEFGRFANRITAPRLNALRALYAALGVVRIAYNGLADLLPSWIAEYEPLSASTDS